MESGEKGCEGKSYGSVAGKVNKQIAELVKMCPEKFRNLMKAQNM